MNEKDPILADELNRRINAEMQGQKCWHESGLAERIEQEAAERDES